MDGRLLSFLELNVLDTLKYFDSCKFAHCKGTVPVRAELVLIKYSKRDCEKITVRLGPGFYND